MRPGTTLFTAVWLAATAAATVGATTPASLVAQSRPAIDVALPGGPSLQTEGPVVRTSGILNDAQMRDLLRNGFPARLHYRVELWTVGGFFNDLDRTAEWDVIVRYDPLDRSYRVARIIGDRVVSLGQFRQYADAEATVALPFRAPIAARKGKRSYYNVSLDVETLSLTELDEVERWLRGELKPAVRGQRNPVTPVTRGLRTLFVRLIGGERRHYEVRSATFRG